jgi:hypothetical protein
LPLKIKVACVFNEGSMRKSKKLHLIYFVA